MDCSPPGSSVHGIFQARVLEWGANVFPIGEFKPFSVQKGTLTKLWHQDPSAGSWSRWLWMLEPNNQRRTASFLAKPPVPKVIPHLQCRCQSFRPQPLGLGYGSMFFGANTMQLHMFTRYHPFYSALTLLSRAALDTAFTLCQSQDLSWGTQLNLSVWLRLLVYLHSALSVGFSLTGDSSQPSLSLRSHFHPFSVPLGFLRW